MARRNAHQKNNGSTMYQTPYYALEPLLQHIDSSDLIYEPACYLGYLSKPLQDRCYQVYSSDILPSEQIMKGAFGSVDFTKVLDQEYRQSNQYRGEWIRSVMNREIKIVTNPPFDTKTKNAFIRVCVQSGKPFALLMPITALETPERGDLWDEVQARPGGLEIIHMNPRVKFICPDGREEKDNNPNQMTCWYTWGFKIGKPHTFARIDRSKVYHFDTL